MNRVWDSLREGFGMGDASRDFGLVGRYISIFEDWKKHRVVWWTENKDVEAD